MMRRPVSHSGFCFVTDNPAPRLANQVAWVLLAALALAVAGYALSIALWSEQRAQLSPLAAQLVAVKPWLALLHFGAGGVALAVGVLQFAKRLRERRPVIHRWLGRVYVVTVLGSGSAGFLLATQTTAGVVAATGFAALAVLWLLTTVQGYRAIRARHVLRHRTWMARSFALTLAAVTLRLYLPLSQLAGLPFESAYAGIAWLCWVPNLLIAEQWARRSAKKKDACLGRRP
jgi:uncharacterized membrane protein